MSIEGWDFGIITFNDPVLNVSEPINHKFLYEFCLVGLYKEVDNIVTVVCKFDPEKFPSGDQNVYFNIPKNNIKSIVSLKKEE